MNQSNFSFEIEQTNNMIVPTNVAQPIRDINFVRLPMKIELYREVAYKNSLKWEVDKQSVRMLPTTLS